MTQHLSHVFALFTIAAAITTANPLPVADGPPKVIRVGDVIGGHVHPSLCVTKTGRILAVYNKSGGGGKELLLSTSTDGGKTWSKSAAVPGIADCSIYPGSLTTLKDGRILLNWSCYRVEGERRWRVPQFCISNNEGKDWTAPRDLPLKNMTNYSCLRHPVLELSPDEWVCPLYDRTVVYNHKQHTVRPFGDGRNHGMVPIVRTQQGTLISGAPKRPPPSRSANQANRCAACAPPTSAAVGSRCMRSPTSELPATT